jgi:hypothetical protein
MAALNASTVIELREKHATATVAAMPTAIAAVIGILIAAANAVLTNVVPAMHENKAMY